MIKPRNYPMILIALFILILVSACVVSESYKTGQGLIQANRWEEAIGFFEQAVKEDPNKQEYRDELNRAKREAAKVRYEKARQVLASAPEANLHVLEQVAKEAGLAYNLDPENSAIKAFDSDIRGKVNALTNNLKSLSSQAEVDMQKEDWMTAVAKLRQIVKVSPTYENAANRLLKAEQEGTRMLYQQGLAFGKQEEWGLAVQAFKSAMDINPNYLDVAKLYRDAMSRDNADYYVSEAEKARQGQDWERAIRLLEKAGKYQPDNRDLVKKLEDMRIHVGQIYFEEAVRLVNQGKFYKAFKRLELVTASSPSLLDGPIYREFVNNFCAKLVDRAGKFSGREMWGNSLIWLQRAEALNRDYQGLFQRILEVKDQINKRIKKSIAVFDFSSPSNDRDAGKIAANKLIAYLHRNASGDLRIIERENLQSILREMQLGQTGLVDIKAVQTAKMRGIDTFIMGDVLHFAATKTDTPSISQVKALVDETDEPNPQFLLWSMANQRPTPEQLNSAPPTTIKKKIYQFISYRQGTTKISSIIEVSYKLVDTLTGENIFTNTIAGKMFKEDKYQDAVPAAGIPYDPLELPTEVEVMDELTNEKVSVMGQTILKNFQSLEVEYFNQGQQYQKRRNPELSIERFTDAIFDEKLKGISTPISQKSMDIIAELVQYE
ncbi:MAG: tetratricopeptide repeat protein [Desulfobacterales bacterium]|nr:tetratricopeptide repeat protein [Desulfobacterales bacterium]